MPARYQKVLQRGHESNLQIEETLRFKEFQRGTKVVVLAPQPVEPYGLIGPCRIFKRRLL